MWIVLCFSGDVPGAVAGGIGGEPAPERKAGGGTGGVLLRSCSTLSTFNGSSKRKVAWPLLLLKPFTSGISSYAMLRVTLRTYFYA